MSKKLYLVRHGQTLFNKKGLMQGWCDSPLTDFGHEQAKKTGEYMKEKGMNFDHAFCSTLGRTEETLKEITDLPYERKEGLKEMSFGDLEGDDIDTVQHMSKDPMALYVEHGGEDKDEVASRMYDALKEIMDNPEVENALAVSHGACSFRFANKIDPIRAKKLRKFNNCIIYEFDYDDGKFALKRVINEHVKDLKDPVPDINVTAFQKKIEEENKATN